MPSSVFDPRNAGSAALARRHAFRPAAPVFSSVWTRSRASRSASFRLCSTTTSAIAVSSRMSKSLPSSSLPESSSPSSARRCCELASRATLGMRVFRKRSCLVISSSADAKVTGSSVVQSSSPRSSSVINASAASAARAAAASATRPVSATSSATCSAAHRNGRFATAGPNGSTASSSRHALLKSRRPRPGCGLVRSSSSPARGVGFAAARANAARTRARVAGSNVPFFFADVASRTRASTSSSPRTFDGILPAEPLSRTSALAFAPPRLPNSSSHRRSNAPICNRLTSSNASATTCECTTEFTLKSRSNATAVSSGARPGLNRHVLTRRWNSPSSSSRGGIAVAVTFFSPVAGSSSRVTSETYRSEKTLNPISSSASKRVGVRTRSTREDAQKGTNSSYRATSATTWNSFSGGCLTSFEEEKTRSRIASRSGTEKNDRRRERAGERSSRRRSSRCATPATARETPERFEPTRSTASTRGAATHRANPRAARRVDAIARAHVRVALARENTRETLGKSRGARDSSRRAARLNDFAELDSALIDRVSTNQVISQYRVCHDCRTWTVDPGRASVIFAHTESIQWLPSPPLLPPSWPARPSSARPSPSAPARSPPRRPSARPW